MSGIDNGIAGIGGLPIVLFFLASKTAVSLTRATIIMFFLFTDAYASIINFASGILTPTSWMGFLVFLIPLLLGLFVGNRQFTNAAPESFKRMALFLLISLSILGLVRAMIGA